MLPAQDKSASADWVCCYALPTLKGTALDLGVLSDRTFAMMAIMALATTVMAAPIVNRFVSRDDVVGQLAAAGLTARPISFLTDDVGRDLTRIAADPPLIWVMCPSSG